LVDDNSEGAAGSGQEKECGSNRVAEGHLLHALSMSYGSLRELETQLLLSGRLKFLGEQDLRELFDQCEEIGRILNGLMKTVKSRVRTKHMKA
jgi:four helix bundle protein